MATTPCLPCKTWMAAGTLPPLSCCISMSSESIAAKATTSPVSIASRQRAEQFLLTCERRRLHVDQGHASYGVVVPFAETVAPSIYVVVVGAVVPEAGPALRAPVADVMRSATFCGSSTCT